MTNELNWARAVRKVRELFGITLRRGASDINSRIGHIESGLSRQPNTQTLLILCDQLGIPFWSLAAVAASCCLPARTAISRGTSRPCP